MRLVDRFIKIEEEKRLGLLQLNCQRQEEPEAPQSTEPAKHNYSRLPTVPRLSFFHCSANCHTLHSSQIWDESQLLVLVTLSNTRRFRSFQMECMIKMMRPFTSFIRPSGTVSLVAVHHSTTCAWAVGVKLSHPLNCSTSNQTARAMEHYTNKWSMDSCSRKHNGQHV